MPRYQGVYKYLISVMDTADINRDGQLDVEAVWPNPSTGAVTVAYQVVQAGSVRLEVFDVLGRLVATYEEHLQHAGSYQTELNLSALAAGTYVRA